MSMHYERKATAPLSSLNNVDHGCATVLAVRGPENVIQWGGLGGEVIRSRQKAEQLAKKLDEMIHANGSDRAFRNQPDGSQ